MDAQVIASSMFFFFFFENENRFSYVVYVISTFVEERDFI